MEGKDVDLLFGLDMLRRHQACIDLLKNELRFPHTAVKFLPESEIPKRWEEAMMDEPTVQGPNGTEIGAKTGAVRPAGSSQEAAQHLHPEKGGNSAGKQPDPVLDTGGASSSSKPAASRYPEKAINDLVGLGFSRQEAIQALDATGGNVELAAGLLFQ